MSLNFPSCAGAAIKTYTLPQLHKGKRWYVDFCQYDPAIQRMRRKKYHLDSIKKAADRNQMAAVLIKNITERLLSGWNVWSEQQESLRQQTEYVYVCSRYIRYIQKLADSGAIKISTLNSYNSYLNVFNNWLQRVRAYPVVYIYEFKTNVISEFLDYVLLDLDVSARTRNNYLVWLNTFCKWLREKRYIDENPCKEMRKLREAPKYRQQLSASELAVLREYLTGWNRHFLLACMMEYYTFIRPEELTHVKVGDINIREQRVLLSGSYTKNRRDGAVGLTEDIIKLMVDLDTFRHASGEYLFGGRDFRPGIKKLDSRAFRETFVKVRKKLKWPASYQFYSLKDTGIRDLANAEGIVVARDQARHTDISTTNKYLKGGGMAVHEETKHFKGGL